MAAFGTVFMPEMSIAQYRDGQWQSPKISAADTLSLHPGAHALHYASTCFEGLKAFKHADGSVHIFRLDQNVKRMRQSSQLLALPEVDAALLEQMIVDIVKHFKSDVPEPPGSMYIRPTHIGTEPAIGKAASAATQSLLYVLLSPVGDYFAGGTRPLKLLVETDGMRCAPHMGMIKSGGNYASALNPIMRARAQYGADQVLFCPNGDVQETGAANFLLIDGDEIITKDLDSSFLHGITRDSILTIAKDMGMKVSERALSVDELLERAQKPETEAALSGTAAVLTPVGSLLYNDQTITVGTGEEGTQTQQLRRALNEIQWGQREDTFGWLTTV